MYRPVVFVLLVSSLILLPSPAQADGSVAIRLVDDAGQPLGQLPLRIFEGDRGRKTSTDDDGFVVGGMEAGTKVVLQATSAGQRYSPRTFVVPVEDGQPFDVTLSPAGAGGTNPDEAPFIQVGETVSGNTAVDGVTVEALDCPWPIDAPGVWFLVQGTGEMLTASTCDQAGYDTKLSVYCMDAECGDSSLGTCVGGNDDATGCSGFTSKLSWCSEVGVLYAILVHGFNGDSGPFDLTLTGDGGNCSVGSGVSCLSPPPLGVCCTCLNRPFNCAPRLSIDECLAIGGDFMGPCVDCLPLENSSRPDQDIPDNGYPVFVADTIDVQSSWTITDVNVGLWTSHSWIGDVHHVVESPDTTQVTLWAGNCDDALYYYGIDTVFDDDGTAQFCNATGYTPSPFDGNGRLRPLGGVPLSVFNGSSTSGTWTMYSADDFPGDVGALLNWYLEFNNQPSGTVCDFNYDEDPDDIFTICHCPPGLPEGPCHTMTVGEHAAAAHLLNHGNDLNYPCEGGP